MDNNYSFSYVAGDLTIDKALLTVDANDAAKTYDGVAFAGGNGVTFAGFVNGDDDGDLGGLLTYGGTSQGAVDAGTYSITAGGYTSGNYTISYTDGVLSVGQARMVVTADPKNKVFGTTDPALTYTYLGTLYGKDAFTGGLVRDPGEAVGFYLINQGSLALSPNYALAFVGADFEITPAPLQAQLDLEDIYRTFEAFGGPASSFSVTILGLPGRPVGPTGAGAPGLDLADSLANIAPAAGGEGNENSVEAELAGVEPAAGGQTPSQANCWAQAVRQASSGAAVSYSFGNSMEEALNQTAACVEATDL